MKTRNIVARIHKIAIIIKAIEAFDLAEFEE